MKPKQMEQAQQQGQEKWYAVSGTLLQQIVDYIADCPTGDQPAKRALLLVGAIQAVAQSQPIQQAEAPQPSNGQQVGAAKG